MVEHEGVYSSQADLYEQLILREDYQGNLFSALEKIGHFSGLDIIELGAGTGRLTRWMAPFATRVAAFDLSPHMLTRAAAVLFPRRQNSVLLAVGNHLNLPAASSTADLVIAGWSVCYLVSWHPDDWQPLLERALAEMTRTLRPGGKIILVETQGTGGIKPNPPEKLVRYYQTLEKNGFQSTWIRTDYRFKSMEEAEEITRFFFGEEMLTHIQDLPRPILPECTGIWWRENCGA